MPAQKFTKAAVQKLMSARRGTLPPPRPFGPQSPPPAASGAYNYHEGTVTSLPVARQVKRPKTIGGPGRPLAVPFDAGRLDQALMKVQQDGAGHAQLKLYQSMFHYDNGAQPGDYRGAAPPQNGKRSKMTKRQRARGVRTRMALRKHPHPHQVRPTHE